MTTQHLTDTSPEAKAERQRRRHAESARLRRELGISAPSGRRPRARAAGKVLVRL